MKRRASVLALCAAAWALAAPGCADVGDDSAVPGELSVGGDAGVDLLADATSAGDAAPGSGQGPSTGPEPGADGGGSPTPGSDDAGVGATGLDATDDEDAGATDATIASDGGLDATIADGASDASGSVVDSGGGGTVDAGTDAGRDSDSGLDAGQDASRAADAGVDAAGVLVACTAAGQTGCVQCGGSASGVCTPTEALLVEHDIAKGLATAPGADPDTGCYYCLYQAGGLDDVTFGDTGNECGDLTGGAADQAKCEATIGCILSSSCASAEVSSCYCGTAPVSGTCNDVGATNAANGACAASIATGLGFAENDGHDILTQLENTTLPSGIADKIFQAAISNTCSACLQ